MKKDEYSGQNLGNLSKHNTWAAVKLENLFERFTV
jgi:hypothetical protein